MRYTLKDYQDDAVADVLDRLARARDDWQRWKSPVAFSLTATTGAGKTVMAAAVIEALFDGNANYNFHPDPGAVVLWFTDDPSLNDQTRLRLLDAADQIGPLRLVVVNNTFDQAKLEPGRIYFLNTQKLGKKSRLVRETPEDPQERTPYDAPAPDARAFTMWNTLANTITDDDITLYLILDEAHRGMKPASKGERDEKDTIVQRLVNGTNGVPSVPIVWGISATVERFNDAMAKAKNRTVTLPWSSTRLECRNLGCSKTTSGSTSPPRAVSSTPHCWRAVPQEGQASHSAVARLCAQRRRPNSRGGRTAPCRASAKHAVERTPRICVNHHSRELARTRT